MSTFTSSSEPIQNTKCSSIKTNVYFNLFFPATKRSLPNFLLLEGSNLKKSNILVKNFSKEKKLACIPCYHDTENTIKYTIKEYAKKFNLYV